MPYSSLGTDTMGEKKINICVPTFLYVVFCTQILNILWSHYAECQQLIYSMPYTQPFSISDPVIDAVDIFVGHISTRLLIPPNTAMHHVLIRYACFYIQWFLLNDTQCEVQCMKVSWYIKYMNTRVYCQEGLVATNITRFMRPTWGHLGRVGPRGPMLAHWTLLSGYYYSP